MDDLASRLPLAVALLAALFVCLEVARFRRREAALVHRLNRLSERNGDDVTRYAGGGEHPTLLLPPVTIVPTPLLDEYQQILNEYRQALQYQLEHEQALAMGDQRDLYPGFPTAERIEAFLNATREERWHEQHAGAR